MDGNGETNSFDAKIWNHPSETTNSCSEYQEDVKLCLATVMSWKLLQFASVVLKTTSVLQIFGRQS